MTTTTGVAINILCEQIHVANRAWYYDVTTGTKLAVDVPLKLALTHAELSEALEGHRKDAMDDHLPHRKSIEVELADALIRIMDLGAALSLDLGGALVEKMQYNACREDHKPENRLKPGGKKY